MSNRQKSRGRPASRKRRQIKPSTSRSRRARTKASKSTSAPRRSGRVRKPTVYFSDGVSADDSTSSSADTAASHASPSKRQSQKRGRSSSTSLPQGTSSSERPAAARDEGDPTGPDDTDIPDVNEGRQPGDRGTVLFYGDSITWGMAHNYTGRYEMPWPRLIEPQLNSLGFHVVESALCSRTTTWDDDGQSHWMDGGEPHDFNGLDHFAVEFISASPSWLVLMLGTNDLRKSIRMSAKRTRVDASLIANNCAKIALLARRLHQTVLYSQVPLKIIFIAPPSVRLNPLAKTMGYDDLSMTLSKSFSAAYGQVAKMHRFKFVDTDNVDMSQSVDGVHITDTANRQVARKVLNAFIDHYDVAVEGSFASRIRQLQQQNTTTTATATTTTSTIATTTATTTTTTTTATTKPTSNNNTDKMKSQPLGRKQVSKTTKTPKPGHTTDSPKPVPACKSSRPPGHKSNPLTVDDDDDVTSSSEGDDGDFLYPPFSRQREVAENNMMVLMSQIQIRHPRVYNDFIRLALSLEGTFNRKAVVAKMRSLIGEDSEVLKMLDKFMGR